MVKILKFLGLGLLTNCHPCLVNKKREPKMISDAVNSYTLQKEDTRKSLLFLTDLPHPMNSPRQVEVRDHIVSRLQSMNIEASVQSFPAETPNRNAGAMLAPLSLTKQGHNVLARLNLVNKPQCILGLASHYDTKDIEAFAYVGANDSGSSSVLLLDLARFLLKNKSTLKLQCDIQLIWFDGEEAVLQNWNDGLQHPARLHDNTYGSRRFVQDLEKCSDEKETPFLGLILLDMLGFTDLKLSVDHNSHEHLKSLLVAATKFLEKNDLLGLSLPIEDDHIPFKEKGVAVLDIIDFNHMNHWHTPLDRFESVSMDSLELSGKIALYVLLNAALNPEPLGKKGGNVCLKPIQGNL